jgi:hypothetical protein
MKKIFVVVEDIIGGGLVDFNDARAFESISDATSYVCGNGGFVLELDLVVSNPTSIICPGCSQNIE